MPKQDTLTLLDELQDLGLDDPLFSMRLHHLGDSFNGFHAFCAGKVNDFRKDQCNQLLHDRLAFIRAQCKEGKLPLGRSMVDLVEEARKMVPRKGFSNCKKHVSDPSLK